LYEYRVLEFTLNELPNLEESLNTYAKSGWRVVSVFSKLYQGIFAGSVEGMVVIIERDQSAWTAMHQ
jgi:hypothetical protein